MRRFLFMLVFVLAACAEAARSQEADGVCTRKNASYVVKRGDTLNRIAARFGIEPALIARQNGLKLSALLKAGSLLQIENPHLVPQTVENGIIVNIPQRMMFFFRDGRLLHAYPVGVGVHDWETPTGGGAVATKRKNPVWHVPRSIQEEMASKGQPVKTEVPHCKENPLGDYFIGLDFGDGIGLHSTNAPGSIYGFRTHGCIRLHPDAMKELFPAVAIGAPVLIVYKRVMVGRCAAGIFMEANPDPYGKQAGAIDEIRRMAQAQGLESEIDWEKVAGELLNPTGLAVEITKRAEAYPVQTEMSISHQWH